MAACSSRELAPHDQSDQIIKAYNDVWTYHERAWIVTEGTNGKNTFTVVSEVKADVPEEGKNFFGMLMPSTVRKKVSEAYLSTQYFLCYYTDRIDADIHDHEKFLSRISRSFKRDQCGQHCDEVALQQKVEEIRRKCDSGFDFQTNLSIHHSRIPREQLSYTAEEYQICDLLFIVGKNEIPIPVVRFSLCNRNERWKAFICSGEAHTTSMPSTIRRPDWLSTSFISLINIIHTKGDSAYPTTIKELLELSILAYEMDETEILDACAAKIEPLKTKLPLKALLDIYHAAGIDKIPDKTKLKQVHQYYDAWIKEIPSLTFEDVFVLVQLEKLNFSENSLLGFLEKWEEAQLSTEEPQGTLLNKCNSDGRNLLSYVRFECINYDNFLSYIMEKEYIDRDLRISLCKLHASKEYGFSLPVQQGWEEPRAVRGSWIRVQKGSRGDYTKEIMVNARIPIDPKKLKKRKKGLIFAHSEIFMGLGEEWQFQLNFQRFNDDQKLTDLDFYLLKPAIRLANRNGLEKKPCTYVMKIVGDDTSNYTGPYHSIELDKKVSAHPFKDISKCIKEGFLEIELKLEITE